MSIKVNSQTPYIYIVIKSLEAYYTLKIRKKTLDNFQKLRYLSAAITAVFERMQRDIIAPLDEHNIWLKWCVIVSKNFVNPIKVSCFFFYVSCM